MQTPARVNLPSDLPISRASFFVWGSEISRVTAGSVDDVPEWTFLCSVPGDFGYWQTVVAFRTSVQLRSLSTLWTASGLSCERLDDYLLVYRHRTEISSKALPTFVEDCRRLVRYLRSDEIADVPRNGVFTKFDAPNLLARWTCSKGDFSGDS
jgi:hypothetical protein